MSQRQQQRQQQGHKQMPRGAGVYPADLVPIALPGDLIKLRPDDEVREVVTVTSNPTIRAFQSDKSNSVSVSANSTSSDNSADALMQRDGWLAQYRVINPEKDFPSGIDEVQVDLGGSQAPLYTSKNARGFFNADTGQIAGMSGILDLYIWEDEEPQFTFENDSGSSITIQDVGFAGYEYELSDPIQEDHRQPVVVPTEAIASVGR